MEPARKQGKSSGQLGQAMTELVLIMPLLALILLVTIDLGRAFYTYTALTNAAREAARYAAVNDTAATSAQVTGEFTPPGGSDISGCADGSLTFSATGGGRGQDYTVTVSCKFTLLTPFMVNLLNATGNQITIRSTATFVWE